MQPTLKCESRPSESKTIPLRDSACPVIPLPYKAVSKAWTARSGEKLSPQRCREITEDALQKLFRAVRRQYPTMAEDLDLHWTGTQRGTVRQRSVMTKKRAGKDAVGGRGKDAPGTED